MWVMSPWSWPLTLTPLVLVHLYTGQPHTAMVSSHQLGQSLSALSPALRQYFSRKIFHYPYHLVLQFSYLCSSFSGTSSQGICSPTSPLGLTRGGVCSSTSTRRGTSSGTTWAWSTPGSPSSRARWSTSWWTRRRSREQREGTTLRMLMIGWPEGYQTFWPTHTTSSQGYYSPYNDQIPSDFSRCSLVGVFKILSSSLN